MSSIARLSEALVFSSHRSPRSARSWVCPSCRRASPSQVPRRSHANEVSALELSFGQPVHETHPHLLQPGELTPGISAVEYAARRTRLAEKLPSNSIAVLAAAEIKYKSGAVFYRFHQDSNFFYLTGFNEPEALAVIAKSSDPNDYIFHLYVRPRDPKAEIWEGPRSGLEAATDVFNADETGSISTISSSLPPLLSSASCIYTDIPFAPSSTSRSSNSIFSRFLSSLRKISNNATTSTSTPSSSTDTTGSSSATSSSLASLVSSLPISPLKPLVHDLRAVKSEAEIKLLREVGQVTGRAFQGVMRRRWDYESEIEAWMEYDFRKRGMDGNAYVPVVAGGKNALSIHYTRNDAKIDPSSLLLLDAGAERGHYITDVTRTFPISNLFSSSSTVASTSNATPTRPSSPPPKFAPAQRDLYTAVLNVQRSIVSLCRESAGHSLDKLHSITEDALRRELGGLGFQVQGKNLDTLFPHHVGHYIGLDVHDTPGYSRTTPLKEGMCITIEPGVHVPTTPSPLFPSAFRGMGIQIEDSICVGKDEPLILSAEAPKEVEDIEALGRWGVEEW